jgi:hypothetical protein
VVGFVKRVSARDYIERKGTPEPTVFPQPGVRQKPFVGTLTPSACFARGCFLGHCDIIETGNESWRFKSRAQRCGHKLKSSMRFGGSITFIARLFSIAFSNLEAKSFPSITAVTASSL